MVDNRLPPFEDKVKTSKAQKQAEAWRISRREFINDALLAGFGGFVGGSLLGVPVGAAKEVVGQDDPTRSGEDASEALTRVYTCSAATGTIGAGAAIMAVALKNRPKKPAGTTSTWEQKLEAQADNPYASSGVEPRSDDVLKR